MPLPAMLHLGEIFPKARETFKPSQHQLYQEGLFLDFYAFLLDFFYVSQICAQVAVASIALGHSS